MWTEFEVSKICKKSLRIFMLVLILGTTGWCWSTSPVPKIWLSAALDSITRKFIKLFGCLQCPWRAYVPRAKDQLGLFSYKRKNTHLPLCSREKTQGRSDNEKLQSQQTVEEFSTLSPLSLVSWNVSFSNYKEFWRASADVKCHKTASQIKTQTSQAAPKTEE